MTRTGTAMQAIRYVLDPSVGLDDDEGLDFLAEWLGAELTGVAFEHFEKWLASHPDQTEEEGR